MQTVDFPEGVKTDSLGRNGHMQTIGINLCVLGQGPMATLSLSPVNSRGNIGRGDVRLPLDVEILAAVEGAIREVRLMLQGL